MNTENATKTAFIRKRVTEEAYKRLGKIMREILQRDSNVKEAQSRNAEEKG